MGLFGSIGNMLTSPFRAVGQLVQGKPRGFVGALGDAVKPAGIVMSAAGLPIGIPIAGVGGMMQKADDEGQRGIGDFLMGGAQGAGMAGMANLGGGLVRSGINALQGAGGASTMSALPAAPIPNLGTAITNTSNTVANIPSAFSGVTSAANTGGGMWSGIGKFLTAHPEVVTQTLGTAANMYGAGMQGAAIDRELEFRREQEEERRRQNELAMLFNALTRMGGGY